MANYIPDELLPIYPTYTTIVKDGIKYKAYFETDWHQVLTEDGVSLCELLAHMPTSTENYYRFCRVLRPTSTETAIEQLYAITNPEIGDVYLVETDMLVDNSYVCEAYVWLREWVYCGTTNRELSLKRDLPGILKLFPDTLGEPEQALIVSKDGKSITWGNPLKTHNEDPKAHSDIRKAIDLKADKMTIINDTLYTGGWVYNGDYPGFEYYYMNSIIPVGAYFEITPIIDNADDAKVITAASISGIFKIESGANKVPFAILNAKRVPARSIPICVKVFGTYNVK